MCWKSTFSKCAQSDNSPGAIDSNCLGLSLKSIICSESKTNGHGSFVKHMSKTQDGIFSMQNCMISSCTAGSGTIISNGGTFCTTLINISCCTGVYATIVTNFTDNGSFHRFNTIKNSLGSQTIVTFEEFYNIVRDTVIINNTIDHTSLRRGIVQTFGEGTLTKLDRCIMFENHWTYVLVADEQAEMILTSCYVQSGSGTYNVKMNDNLEKEEVETLIARLRNYDCICFKSSYGGSRKINILSFSIQINFLVK